MSMESDKEQKAALRKKRRKKERIQALALVGGVFVLGLAVVIGVTVGLVHLFSSSSQNKESQSAVTEAEEGTVSWDDSEPSEAEEAAAGEETGADAAEESEEAALDTAKGESAQSEESAEETKEETDAEETTGGTEEAGETEESDEAEVTGEANEENLGASQESRDEEIEARITEQLAQMSDEEKVSKLFVLTPGQLTGTELESATIGNKVGDQLSRYPISGILFRDSNLDTEENLYSALSNLKSFSMGSLLYFVSDRGGEESPFVKSGMTENIIASQKEIGEGLGSAGAYSAGISLGSELKHYGMQVNIAPCADVAKTSGSYAASHGFGTDLNTTAELTANMVRGLTDQGIIAAVGCFPGYGDVPGDGNGSVPVSQRTREQLLEESKPYQDAIKSGAQIIIISHVGLPKLRGDQRPASLSKEVITDIVREEWGYDGVIMTDYMDKSCIYQKYTYAEAAVGAIEAGADILLATKNFQKSYAALLDAVKKGTISKERLDESVRRILRLKYRNES